MAISQPLPLDKLKAMTKVLRRHIVRMTTEAGSGHPTSSMSAVEMVTALFFGGFMKHDPAAPRWAERDRFILSKGHAVPVLYAALAESGYFPVEELMTLRKLGSRLEGHPNMKRLECIEASTGSLGQGLSVGIGHAIACRMDKNPAHTYVMMGDGEMGEGQVWEALATGEKYKLSNLTAIIDQNGFQQTGATKDVLNLTEFQPKLEAFGWHVQTINGNDIEEVIDALTKARAVKDNPTAIVSKTQKGFGILPIIAPTGDLNYHGKPLSKELAEKALALLAD